MGKIVTFRRRRRHTAYRRRFALVVLLCAGAAFVGGSWLMPAAEPAAGPAAGSAHVVYAICRGGPRINCVVDGDTFYRAGKKIRIADIDTPETHSPRCSREKLLGERATARLVELLNSAPFVLRQASARDRDRYGRLLRTVEQRGRSVGGILVTEGLARPWTGRRASWCT